MTNTFKRSCPICEAACGLVIHADPVKRQVIRIEGDPEDFRSQGFVCPKSQAMKAAFEDPQRLRRPVKKSTNGSWQEISWQQAFAEVTDRLLAIREQHGYEALGVYLGNPIGFDAGGMLYSTHFMRSLMTTHVFTAATMDHFPKLFASKALYGRANILPIPDIDRCELFICIGANPVVSQGSLMSAPGIKSRLTKLQKRGGQVIVIDPRRSETAELANQHHFIQPGTDAFLLFAMVQVIFAEGLQRFGHLEQHLDGVEQLKTLSAQFTPERVASITGIAASNIKQLARLYAGTEKAICYGRIGTCTVSYGGITSWLLDVLGLITGHMDSEGGMMFPRPPSGELEAGPANEFTLGRWQSAVRGFPEIDGQLPSAVMAEEIDSADPQRKIRSMVMVAGNPVLSTANGERLDKALEQLDFMVAVDLYINESTRHADIILPPLTQLEQDNFDALPPGTASHNYARYSQQVFEPEPGGLPQWTILLELAARLNGENAEDYEQQLLASQAKRLHHRMHHCEKSLEEVMTLLLQQPPGPSRLIDLMVRAGPYGDGFSDQPTTRDPFPQQLSLAQLKRSNLPVDLGPLRPRLSEILRTPNRRINLLIEPIANDIGRLIAQLDTASAELAPTEFPLRLIGRRHLQDMNSWLHNMPNLAKGKPRCVLLMHPGDAEPLDIANGQSVSLRSRVGGVSVTIELSDSMMPGVVSLPHGFGHLANNTQITVANDLQPGVNANTLTDELQLDPLTGTSIANGIPVAVAGLPTIAAADIQPNL